MSPLLLCAWLTTASASDSLEAQVESLQSQVDTLEARVAALEAQLAKTAPDKPTATDELAADRLYTAAQEQAAAGDVEAARQSLAQLKASYPTTRAAKRTHRLDVELSVVGKRLDDNWPRQIEQWVQGERRTDLQSGTVVLLYWETWCPHCRREIPKWQKTWETMKQDGLKVVGLTRLTRTSTRQLVEEFVQEHNIAFPVAKETGALADFAQVSGIPAAVVLDDGVVVWRGHPARINEAMLRGWLTN